MGKWRWLLFQAQTINPSPNSSQKPIARNQAADFKQLRKQTRQRECRNQPSNPFEGVSCCSHSGEEEHGKRKFENPVAIGNQMSNKRHCDDPSLQHSH